MTALALSRADARRILTDPARAQALPHLRAIAWTAAARDFGIRIDMTGLLAEARRLHANPVAAPDEAAP
jgi:hypothetical protein